MRGAFRLHVTSVPETDFKASVDKLTLSRGAFSRANRGVFGLIEVKCAFPRREPLGASATRVKRGHALSIFGLDPETVRIVAVATGNVF